MGLFGKLFSRSASKKAADSKTGDMRKATGAGPAIAAHSRDAKSTSPTGNNPAAAAKKK